MSLGEAQSQMSRVQGGLAPSPPPLATGLLYGNINFPCSHDRDDQDRRSCGDRNWFYLNDRDDPGTIENLMETTFTALATIQTIGVVAVP